MTPKRNNWTGNSLPYPQYYGGFLSGSQVEKSLKIAPKHDTKNTYPPIPAVTAEMGDFSIRRTYAENVKENEERACVLSQ